MKREHITAEKIEAIQDIVFDRHNYRSRPFGHAYISLVNEIINELVERDFTSCINSEVIEILTSDNYHTVATACELVRKAVF